jgi:EmrB/QacA subfamily drug resistance transporter
MTTIRRDPSPNLLLLLLCTAHLMGLLDASIVQIALPSIQKEIHFATQDLQWVITAYTLFFGGFLLLGGKIGDWLGRRQTLTCGLALFIIASAAGGLASSPSILIISRALQGLGAAIIAPNVMATVTTLFPEGKKRIRALGMLGSVSAVGFIMGLVLGGLLTTWLGWRWVFFINLPIGLTVMIMLFKILPESKRLRIPIDIPGSILVTLGLGTMVYAFSMLETYGLFSPRTITLFIIAVGLLLAFVTIQLVASNPLIPLSLFRNQTLIGAGLTTVVFGAIIGPVIFLLSLYMQNVLGYSPLTTGLAFLPQEIIVLITSNLIGKYMTSLQVKPVLLGGMGAFGVGVLWLTQLSVEGDYLHVVLPGMIFVGLGVSSVIVAAAMAFTAGVDPHEQGMASGLWNTAPQIGSSLGLAILVSIANSHTQASLGHEDHAFTAIVAGYRFAFTASLGFVALGLISIFILFENRRKRKTTWKYENFTAL